MNKFSKVDVYLVTTDVDAGGSVTESFDLKLEDVQCNVYSVSNFEKIKSGRKVEETIYNLFFDLDVEIISTDRIRIISSPEKADEEYEILEIEDFYRTKYKKIRIVKIENVDIS